MNIPLYLLCKYVNVKNANECKQWSVEDAIWIYSDQDVTGILSSKLLNKEIPARY